MQHLTNVKKKNFIDILTVRLEKAKRISNLSHYKFNFIKSFNTFESQNCDNQKEEFYGFRLFRKQDV